MTTTDETQTTEQSAGWRDLFDAEHRGAVLVIAGGVLMFAMNVYLTAALLPSAVADIGGKELYAWVMTAFLLAGVVASLFVNAALASLGPRRAYVAGFGTFTVGSLIVAVAPAMPVLLAGRAVQGIGGGLLAGLGFAVIRQTLPEPLWGRSLGLVSAMWGVGNLVGPVVGGLFAQVGAWRGALGFLVVLGLALALVAWRSMPAHTSVSGTAAVPGIALALVVAAAAAVSVAGVAATLTAVVLIVVAVVLVVLFVVRERRASVRILPGITYRRGNGLKWVYLGLVVLAVGSTTEAFVPLFGQELGGMGPLVAGLLGAALSWGWSGAAILVSSVDDRRRRAQVRLVGPVMLAIGFAAYALLQRQDPAWPVEVGWFVALVFAGAGIGMAFQHGTTAAMSSIDDEAEASRAVSGVATTQLMANALGSAVAGVLVNLGAPSVIRSAHLLLWSFAALALVAVWTTWRSLGGVAQRTE